MQGDADFELLLKTYELDRGDDAQALSSMYTLFATITSLLSLLGFALINHSKIPPWIVALAPLLPLPFIAIGALHAMTATVRGNVLDLTERELRRRQVRVRGLSFSRREFARRRPSRFHRRII
jgi:hypothetical protein